MDLRAFHIHSYKLNIIRDKSKNIGIRSHLRLMSQDQIRIGAVLQGKHKAFEGIIKQFLGKESIDRCQQLDS